MPATSSVFLNVTDIDRSLEFYRKIGFRVASARKDDSGRVAWADLTFQGADLGLGRIGSNPDPEFQAWVGTPLGAGVIVYFTVPNAARHWKKAQEAGVAVEQPLTERPYGTLFTLNDPDGYTISFFQEPKRMRKAPAKKAKAAKTAKGAKAAKGAKGAKGVRKAAARAPRTTGRKAATGAGKKAAGKTAASSKRSSKAGKTKDAKKGARRG